MAIKPQLHIHDSGYDSRGFVQMWPILYGKIGIYQDGYNINHYDVQRRSYGVPIRIHYDSWRCYYGATKVAPRNDRKAVVLYSESGWIVVSVDIPIHPELPRMTKNTTTVPLGTIRFRYGRATI